jgi:hypothetical protein
MRRRSALTLCAVLASGCGTLDMVSPDPSVDAWRSVTVESWEWGARPGHAELTCPAQEGETPRLSEIVFRQDVGDHLLHFLTLGGYGHATLVYRCAQPATELPGFGSP